MSMDDDRRDGPDEDRLLVGEFALGLLKADEHERLAGRIAADPVLKAELRLWQARLAGLDGEYSEAAAPAGMLERVERRLFSSAAAPAAGVWNNLTLWRSLAGASLAVAAVAVGFNLMQPRIDPQQFATELVAALQAQEGSGVEFVALYDAATGSVRLTALSGEVAFDRDLELWYIKGEEPPVSMGVVRVDGRTEIELGADARQKFGEGIVLAVTLEQKGGSPTGAPQGPVVAAGAATPI